MKNAKHFLFFVFTVALLVMLFSCGGADVCERCVDSDGDLLCDNCKKPIETDKEKSAVLFEDGEIAFSVILSDSLSYSARQTVNSSLKAMLQREFDVTVEIFSESDTVGDEYLTEVLIGDVLSRGEEYFLDGHTLGKEGYAVKVENSKILINAGSDTSLISAIREFASFIKEQEDIHELTLTSRDEMIHVQDDYAVTSLSVDGQDMWGYTIAADLSRDYYEETAHNLRDLFYDKMGYWFDIVDSSLATERAIFITHNKKLSASESFRVSEKNSNIYIECAYDNMLYDISEEFVSAEIFSKEGDVDLKKVSYGRDISTVYYDDFGAVGDGVTDDFDAIYRAHEFANISGQTVKADPGATYYMCTTYYNGLRHHVSIRTNVDWQGAKFIIDNSRLEKDEGAKNYYKLMNSNIFIVEPDPEHKVEKITERKILEDLLVSGINRETDNIPLKLEGWDKGLMIVPYNSSHKVCRKKGYDVYDGSTMQEPIVLDKDGNVSADTPIINDYTALDYIDVYRLDESFNITVENGIFTTVATSFNSITIDENGERQNDRISIARGLGVNRSFTTLRNIEHYTVGEAPLRQQVDDEGTVIFCAPMTSGFFAVSNCTDVLIEDCIMTGSRCYRNPIGGTHGTYDLHANRVNNLLVNRCVQSNFFVLVDEETYEITPVPEGTPGAVTSMSNVTVNGTSLKMHWGIMASNFCKNISYHNSVLSRYDAHAPIYNGEIINCKINYIELTGYGSFTLKDSTYYAANEGAGANAVIPLRADYGSTWDGDLIIDNVDAYVYTSGASYNGVYLIYHKYSNWYYGYSTCFPSLYVNDLAFYDIRTGDALRKGFEVNVAISVTKDSAMHLESSHTDTLLAVSDLDGDGFVDEPTFDLDLDGTLDAIDIDGNGIIGNASVDYQSLINGEDEIKNGYALEGIRININRVRPPRVISITNSNGYVYVVPDTSIYRVSDGFFWDKTESYGGFYGDTTFIFGEGEEDFFVGTRYRKPNDTFIFK